MSMPTITHTGELMVFSTLPSIRQGFSLAVAASDCTNTKRAGLQLALVGAIFSRSYSWCRVLSLMARSCQALWLRALLNSCSRADWLMCVVMACCLRAVGLVGGLLRYFYLDAARQAALA